MSYRVLCRMRRMTYCANVVASNDAILLMGISIAYVSAYGMHIISGELEIMKIPVLCVKSNIPKCLEFDIASNGFVYLFTVLSMLFMCCIIFVLDLFRLLLPDGIIKNIGTSRTKEH